MDSAQAHKIVLAAGGVVAVVTIMLHRNDVSGEARFRALWGVGALTLALALAADLAPELAAPFAVLIAVAMVARNPGELGRAFGLGDRSSSSSSSSSGSGAGSGGFQPAGGGFTTGGGVNV